MQERRIPHLSKSHMETWELSKKRAYYLTPLHVALSNIDENDIVEIIPHNFIPLADPDTLSASVGLYLILTQVYKIKNVQISLAGFEAERAKNAFEYYNDIVNSLNIKINYNYFEKDTLLNLKKECDHLFIVDTNFSRSGFSLNNFQVRKNIITIDHHNYDSERKEEAKKEIESLFIESKNTMIEKIDDIIFPSNDEDLARRASSTSQLILLYLTTVYFKEKIIDDENLKIIDDYKSLLKALYKILRLGIQTDTGSFMYSNTSNALSDIGYFLNSYPTISFEIDQSKFQDQAILKYDSRDLDLIKSLNNRVQMYTLKNGSLAAILFCNDSELKRKDGTRTNLSPVYICTNYKVPIAIAVIFSIVKSENDKKLYKAKIEFRSSTEEMPVLDLARKFDGGGHLCAAGGSEERWINIANSGKEMDAWKVDLINEFIHFY